MYPAINASVKPVRDAPRVIFSPILKNMDLILLSDNPIDLNIAISRLFCWMYIKSREIIVMQATSVIKAKIKNITYFDKKACYPGSGRD